jgi:hypothetical protein
MGDYGNLSGFGGSAGENVSRLDFDFWSHTQLYTAHNILTHTQPP